MKNILFTFVLLSTTTLFSPAQAQVWNQIGQNINGQAQNDAFGYAVSIAADGERVAIVSGGLWWAYVGVYEWSLGSWQQMGEDIRGEFGEAQGSTVFISADGGRVATGSPGNDDNGYNAGQVRIYEWNGIGWQQVGQSINGEAQHDFSGRISLSADGQLVAIGAIRNDGNGEDAGHVRIYEWTGTVWQQVGQDIDGEAAGDRSGSSVSISADGERVAIGAPGNDGNGTDAGHVRVYELNGNTWQQMGQDIDGEAAGDFAASVSISADGERIAIGAGGNGGSTRIFDWNGTEWQQLGLAISVLNHSVSLSSNGEFVVIGKSTNGSGVGDTHILRWTGTVWQQVGQDIEGEEYGDDSGYSVAISAEGERVVIGARFNNDAESRAGNARVFEMSGYNGLEEQQALNNIKVYPNPTGGNMTIDFVEPLEDETVLKLYDIAGRVVMEKKAVKGALHHTFGTENLNAGTYQLRFSIGNEQKIVRVVVAE